MHYHFLFEELDKMTQNLDSREKLKEALETINKILEHVKNRIALKRNLEKQKEIQSAITSSKIDLIDPARK